MEIVLVAGYTALFLFLIRRWKFFRPARIPPVWVQTAFLIKVLAGCILGFIYTYYYTDGGTADTFKFFNDSRILFNALFTSPPQFFEIFFGIGSNDPACFKILSEMTAWNNQDVLFNDNKTLVRLNAIFQFFSLGHYYVHVVFLNFLSFTGMIAIFRLFQEQVNSKSKLLFLCLMLLPSVVFWGSGLLKDGLLLFALGSLLYSFNNLISLNYSSRSVVAFLLSLLLLMFTKLYVLFIILPGLVAWYWSRRNTGFICALKFTACYVIYLFLAFHLYMISEKYDVVDIIYYKQQNFYTLAHTSHARSTISIPVIEPRASSLIMHAPGAILRVLTRPWLTESTSAFVLLAAVENIFIMMLGLLCIAFSRFRKLDGSAPLFCFSIFFVVCMFALIGLITPILGAMVRYKVPAMLFLVFLFISIVDEDKIKRKFPFFQKHQ